VAAAQVAPFDFFPQLMLVQVLGAAQSAAVPQVVRQTPFRHP
jgi:hypothetical protein